MIWSRQTDGERRLEPDEEGVTLHPLARKTVAGTLACLALALGLAACGSSKSNTSSSAASTSSSNAAKVDKAAADTAIQPYIGHPSAFPVTENLKKVPKGATIAFSDCGTPICGLFWQILQPAAKTMGVKLKRYKTGSAASTVSSSFDTMLADKPGAVIVAGTPIDLWKNKLKGFQAAHIPVVTTGILGTQPYGIKAAQAAEDSSNRGGKLMADYVAANFGAGSKVAFYDTPELTFTTLTGQAFKTELQKVCSSCSTRIVHIPITTFGNTAPNQLVSDIQAHPDTTVMVFGTDEVEAGFPAARQTAGITKVKTLGNTPNPQGLEYVKEGKTNAVLGVDLPVLTWVLLDQAARQMAGQSLSGDEAKGLPVLQFLTQKDMKFDPSKGWTGYPDFAQRFAKLWGVGGG
jgi:ribose transport system substrate-binding protein